MSKKIYAVVSLLVLLKLSFSENKLFLCTEYDKNGNYSGTYEDWKIYKGGNFMYLYFTSSDPITDSIKVILYKTFNRKDSTFNHYDHYYLVPDISKKFAVNKYVFSKSGRYKINAYNRNGQLLAPSYITNIRLDLSEYADLQFVDTWYYESSALEFYEKAIGDSLAGKRTVFDYIAPENNIIMYIGQSDKKPFKTNHFYTRIYTDDDCRKLVNEGTYFVNEKWYWTYITININQKGKFVVEVYNDDDVFINSAPLEIK